MRQSNTPQGNQIESPTRLADSPLGIDQRVHLQDIQGVNIVMDEDTPQTGKQNLNPDFRPMDAQEAIEKSATAPEQEECYCARTDH